MKGAVDLDTLEIAAKMVRDAVSAMSTKFSELVKAGLDLKVDKETGKSLSTNDYTTAEKTKLSGIASGAEVNVIDALTVNGDAVTVTGKTAALTMATGVKGDKESAYRTGNVSLTPAHIGAVPTSAVGTANGVAELDSSGKVLSSQLPSYVDDVLEYAALSDFPATGESGKIYVATDSNLTYRWSGSGYVEISPSLALGETPSTAHRGDHGKAAYAHSQTTGNAHNMTKADIGLGAVDNISDADKPVSTPQRAALDLKQDKLSVTGAANRGVYVSAAGVVSQMAHTLDADVPADAQFTDTVTLIDAALSNAGQAADAKAAGDAVTALQAEIAVLRELMAGSDAEYTRTASGNPATFEDGYDAANVKALTVTITPTQSGSGDPSPDNVRPISGASSVTVIHAGANLFNNYATEYMDAEGSARIGYSLVSSIYKNVGVICVDGLSALYVSGDLSDMESSLFRYAFCSEYPRVGTPLTGSAYVSANSAINVPDGAKWMIWHPGRTPDSDFSTRKNVMVNAGTSALPFAPFSDALTVSLVDSNSDPLTVYGGTLNVTTGELTVKYISKTLSSSAGMTYHAGARHSVNYGISGADAMVPGNWINDPNALCDILPKSDYYVDGKAVIRFGDNNNYIFFYGVDNLDGVSDAASWNAWLAEHQPQIVYPLATPRTYQLTPAQLATLSGYNAVYADAGTLSVTYRADPALTLGG